jgi:hypothetical protein
MQKKEDLVLAAIFSFIGAKPNVILMLLMT